MNSLFPTIEQLIDTRKKLKLSARGAALKAGVGRNTVSNLEKGVDISYRSFEKIVTLYIDEHNKKLTDNK